MADDAGLLAALYRQAQAMAADYDLPDMLHQLTREVTEVLGITGAGITLADQDGRLACAAASSEAIGALEQVQEEQEAGPCYDAFNGLVVVSVSDIDTRVEWAGFRAEALRLGVRSVVGVPLRLKADRLGALDLYNDEPRAWSDHELGVARVLADLAAGYVIHEQLQDTRRLAEQLQTALDSRVIIEQAKGIIAADLQISIDDAFEVLRTTSQNSHTTLRAIANAVVTEGFRPTRS
jgi:GAF domain-containing protein